MHIGILLIATGRYNSFIPPLYASLEKYFLPSHKKSYFVFTDSKKPLPSNIQRLFIKHKKHRRWPYVALLQYHKFLSIADRIRAQGIEVLYFLDADMRVVAEVGDEVLPTPDKPFIGTIHPNHYREPNGGNPERNPNSTAYISPDERYPFYLISSFLGGYTEAFFEASTQLKKNTDIDLSNKVIAVWHDESHWNRYMVSHQSQFKLLSHEYSFYEAWYSPEDTTYAPKIFALSKNYAWLRNEYLKLLRELLFRFLGGLGKLFLLLGRGRFSSIGYLVKGFVQKVKGFFVKWIASSKNG